MATRSSIVVVCIAAFSMMPLPGMAWALSQQEIDWCNRKGNPTLDQRIAGCTAAIESGRVGGQNLSIVLQSRGIAYFNKKDYGHAIADFNQSIGIDAKRATTFVNRCNAYWNSKDYERALADCNEAIRLDPSIAEAFNSRAVVYYFMKDYDRAIADYDQVQRLDPNNLNLAANRALAVQAREKVKAGR